jgi:hypothetical protein
VEGISRSSLANVVVLDINTLSKGTHIADGDNSIPDASEAALIFLIFLIFFGRVGKR